jgi:Polyketide cyclase / dehydrase and lipid transport
VADTFSVERSETIAASAQQVHAHIVDFHKWVAWSPWEGIDPNLKRTYGGAAQGVGATYAWEGARKVGHGNMEIVGDTATQIDLKLRFIKPFKANNDTVFALAETNGVTKVTWTMTGPKTLISKVMGVFFSMDKLVGKDFAKGLTQLKSVVESEN